MYNAYNTNPCAYCVNGGLYTPGNMYNGYRSYQCPYYFNTQMYNSDFSSQSYNQYTPLTNEIDGNFRFESSQSVMDDGSVVLKDYGPDLFVVNINEVTKQNDTYRTALWTGDNMQLTLMSLKVGEDIGLEIHPDLDQFIRIEEGQGIVKMGNSEDNLDFQVNVYDDFAFIVPAGTWHNLVNTGDIPLKLYSIYAPPQHPHGTVHETKADAMAAEHD